MSLRCLPWRIKTPAPRIKTPDTAGGRNSWHYQSREHQRWAAAVKCRDAFCCQKCGTRTVRLIADHITEIDDGGAPLDVSNGMTLCIACHNRKTAQVAQARRGRVETRSAGGA
jgi:5-methylcytosine-specific restriction protein A